MGRYRVKKQGTPETAPAEYVDIYVDETSGRLSTIDDAGNVIEYTNIDDEAKVQADAADPTPGYLDAKVDGSTITVDPVTHKMSATIDTNYPTQDIHVAINGSDTTGTGEIDHPYASIKHAMDQITDASTSKRYIIVVSAGNFNEDNPIACKDYVSITGQGSSSTVITAVNNSNNLFDIVGNTQLYDMLIVGPTGAISINVTGSGLSGLQSIVTSSNNRAINLNTTNSEFIMISCSFRNSNIGIYSEGTDDIVIAACQFIDCGTDLEITNVNTTLTTEAVRFSRDKLILPDTYSKFYGTFSDTKPGDEALNVYTELGVGRPEHGKESCFGEGDSYTRGMLVYTYNVSTGDYTNVTDNVIEVDGSNISFPANTIDNAIYVSSMLKNINGDLIRHLGQKLQIDTAQGGGDIIVEFYNGATWEEFHSMGVNSSGNYITYGEDFLQFTGSHQVRFDDSIGTNWQTSDPMTLGIEYYWVRYRIDTAITTSPVIEQIKLHSNRTEINNDGYLEYFGKARPINTLPIIYGSFQAAANSPSNQDLFISDNIGIGMVENSFDNNTVDRTGMCFYMPLDIDTSSPVRFRISYVGEGAGTSSVDWAIRWGYTAPGDFVYGSTAQAPTVGPNEQEITRSTSMPTIAYTLQSEVFELDISGIVPERTSALSGDILWISIERDGNTDTYGSSVNMVSISPFYTKWRDGGNIANWL